MVSSWGRAPRGEFDKQNRYWEKALGMPTREEQVHLLQKQNEDDGFALGLQTEQETNIGSYDRLEVVEGAKADLNLLAALAMPNVFKFFFPPTHLTAWAILTGGEQDAEQKFLQIALGIPRSHAKTTLIKLFCLWCILFSKRQFILVTGSTLARAMDSVSDIADMLDENNIKTLFGDWRLGSEIDTKELKKFGFRGRNIILTCIGAEGSVRGMNIKNARPDVMIFDDIQTKECADSAVQSKTLEEWMVGTAMKAKSPTGCLFIFAGNMFPTPHSILRKLKDNPTWLKFISGAILADGTALWPELRSVESLVEELNNDIAMGQASIFFSEVMNDVSVGINSNVDYSKFIDWPWTDSDLPQGKFIYIDPSQGKNQDCDVIIYAEVYDGKIGVRNIIEEHLSPSNLIRRALIEAIKNNIHCIAVESIGYQFTLLHWFEVICTEVGITGISFVPIAVTTTSKNSRITGGINAMQSKGIILHPSIKSLVQRQLADWNPMKRDNKDDIIDGIANLEKVVADYSYEIMSRENFTLIEATSAKVKEHNTCF